MKILVGVLMLVLAVPAGTLWAQSPELEISSKRYIVIDADSGEVLAEKDADQRVAMASLTKVFTTIEALERGQLDQIVTTKQSDIFGASSTTMGFGPGESFTLKDLIYGMMLPSGNDAAHAIARTLGQQPGDSDDEAVLRFVGFMNERLANMGLTDTQLKNPHGWGVEGHYSTARDIAAFTMYALQYPEFREVIATAQYTTSDGIYTVSNTNRLLNGYSGLIGGKTGYDDDSGYCLIEIAERGGRTLITVTLDGIAPDVWYQDNANLLDFGFSTSPSEATASVQRLSYRDPDAATILAGAVPVSELSIPERVARVQPEASLERQLADAQAPASSLEDVDSVSGGRIAKREAERLALWGALGAVALVVGMEAGRARRSRGIPVPDGG